MSSNPPRAPGELADPVRAAIHAWIREDVPLAGKMNLMPKHVDALLGKIAGALAQIQSDRARLEAENERLRAEVDALRGAMRFIGEMQKSCREAEERYRHWRWDNPIIRGVSDG